MIKLKKIQPVFTRILVTADKYLEDVKDHGITVITKGTLKEYQEVIAVGSTVRLVKEGDIIKVDPKRYAKRKVEGNTIRNDLDLNPIVGFNFPVITINDKDYLYLDEQDVEFIVEDFEEVADESQNESGIVIPDTEIIV